MSVVGAACDRGLIPFAFGAGANLARLDLLALGATIRPIEADAPDSTPFHAALNRLNGLSYGAANLAMPLWVQLDCGVLPSAFVGFARPRADVDEPLRDQLDPAAACALLPIAEALAIPSLVPGTFVSYSLCSVERGLGFATKLLALAAYRCDRAIGVAQYDNSSLRIHARFGPMELLEARAAGHSKPDRTFVYALSLSPGLLARLDAGGDARVPADRVIDVHDRAAVAELDAAVRRGERWAVTGLLPGGVGVAKLASSR
jgi:hypothetical protein